MQKGIDFLIGVNCNPPRLDKPIRSMRTVIERSLLLAVRNKTQERIQQCHLVFEPKEVGKYDIFDVRKAREIFLVGYHSVTKSPDKLRMLEDYANLPKQ